MHAASTYMCAGARAHLGGLNLRAFIRKNWRKSVGPYSLLYFRKITRKYACLAALQSICDVSDVGIGAFAIGSRDIECGGDDCGIEIKDISYSLAVSGPLPIIDYKNPILM